MRELLIRYLLGELEPHEHDAVQQQLAESPELRRELARLRSCFANAVQDDDPEGPPRGLAERTATWVSESSDSFDALPRPRALSEASDAPHGVLGWSLADLTVAGGVMLAVSMLLFPALRNSLDGTRRVMCEKNLQEMGQVFLAYAAKNDGYLPVVQPNENAGIYTVRLVEGRVIREDELKQLLVCPGSPQARLIRDDPRQFFVKIPTQAELDAMSPRELQVTRAWMSPSYAYPFGYLIGPQYYYVRMQGFRRPILCDAPDANGMSPNHGGSIIQVLFADGRVGSLRSAKINGGHDDMFSNIQGEVAAGYGLEDVVLGPSDATPKVFISVHRPNDVLIRGRRMQAIRIPHSVMEN
jgi:prepilin-type processing-associated H-X9-DG protein